MTKITKLVRTSPTFSIFIERSYPTMMEDQAVILKDTRTLLNEEVMFSAKQQAKLLAKERRNIKSFCPLYIVFTWFYVYERNYTNKSLKTNDSLFASSTLCRLNLQKSMIIKFERNLKCNNFLMYVKTTCARHIEYA